MNSITQRGHVIYVKKQNYIPVFLAPQSSFSTPLSSTDNSPRNSNSSTSPLVSTIENGLYEGTTCDNSHECDDVFLNEACSSEDSVSHSRLSAPPDFFLERLHDASIDNDFLTGTTRTLSSRFSVRYSSNISKMRPQAQIKCFCDGYFGCPDDEEQRKCKGKKKKICLSTAGSPSVPWLRRLRKISWYKSKENTHSALAPYNPVSSSTNTLTRGTINYMDRTRKSRDLTMDNINLISDKRDTKCLCSKTHSSAFCNYCFESGCGASHRHSKRWSCDGYFGCPDESAEGKRKGKKKSASSVNSLSGNCSSQSVLKRFLGSKSSIRSTDLSGATQDSISRAPQDNVSRAAQSSEQSSPVVSTSTTVIVAASKKQSSSC